MRLRMKRVYLRIACVAAIVFVVGCAQAPAKSSFRESDATLIEVCFDSMGRNAPQRLLGQEITDISLTTETLELVGFTTTDRPIYQGHLAHPTQFRALFLELPESSVRARIDRPENLASSIDVWRDALPPPTVCTASKQAAMYVLNGRPMPDPIACPDMKMSVWFSVGSRAAFITQRSINRQRPPILFNGLRGCNEFIYGKLSPGHGGD